MERTWLCRKERAEASTLMISPWREAVSLSSVFYRRLRLAFGGAEGGEVVMADEHLRRLVHGLGVERAEHAPGAHALERQRAAPVDDAIEIVARFGREARVEV